MRVLILHNAVDATSSTLERDVLEQVQAVDGALHQLGHGTGVLPCTLDLAALDRELARSRPDLVFNLVESLGGLDRLIHLVPALLEARDVPFTGSSSSTLRRSSHKAEAKAELDAAGIPTLPTLALWPGAAVGKSDVHGDVHDGSVVPEGERWMVKSVWEHGSRGLGDDVVLAPGTAAREAMARLAERLGSELLAEPYVEGRELNLSLLASPSGLRVLPPAEIDFVGYPPGKPRIVGFAAKWDESSFEALHTPRRFDFPPSDAPLLELLAQISRRCWSALDLRGWARVDFRVDASGDPWVLEVNANPCLAPDAGFQAALDRAGIPFDHAVDWICAAARDGGAVGDRAATSLSTRIS